MDDYSYAQVYAQWQAELREAAAADALAARIGRQHREERRARRRAGRGQRPYGALIRRALSPRRS